MMLTPGTTSIYCSNQRAALALAKDVLVQPDGGPLQREARSLSPYYEPRDLLFATQDGGFVDIDGAGLKSSYYAKNSLATLLRR